MLTELHGGPSGGHLGVSKILNKTRQRYCWLQARYDIEKWCRQCNTCAASLGPRTRNRGQMYLYNAGAPFERKAIDVAGPLPRSDQEPDTSWSVWIAKPSGPKPTPFPLKMLRLWPKCSLPTFCAASEYRESYIVTRAVTSCPVWYRRFCIAWEWARRAPHPWIVRLCSQELSTGPYLKPDQSSP
jgi:hypothetical protein